METTPDATQTNVASDQPPVLETVQPAALATRPSQAISPPSVAPSELDRVVAFETRKKSMAMAFVLWWIAGAFGGHRFYLGRTGSATAMLCISLVSIPLMFLLIGFFTILITAVWALVDVFQLAGWVRAHNAEVARSLGAAALVA